MSKIEKQKKFYINCKQKRLENSGKYEQNRKSLKLAQKTGGTFECRGRIQGSYPIYLSKGSLLTEKIVWLHIRKSCTEKSRSKCQI